MSAVTQGKLAGTLLPLLGIVGFFVVLLLVYAVRSLRRQRSDTFMGGRRAESRVIPAWGLDYWFWVITPVERLFIRLRLSPDLITLASVGLSGLAGYLLWQGEFGLAGWCIIFSGTLDILDGRVARAMGRTSRAGAFFDSTMDRYADIFVLAGLVAYYRDGWPLSLPLAAMVGTLLTSYVRARGEGLGVSLPEGLMQRAERVIVLSLGTTFAPLVALWVEPAAAKPAYHLTLVALGALALLTNYTAVFRIHVLYKLLDAMPPLAAPAHRNGTAKNAAPRQAHKGAAR